MNNITKGKKDIPLSPAWKKANVLGIIISGVLVPLAVGFLIFFNNRLSNEITSNYNEWRIQFEEQQQIQDAEQKKHQIELELQQQYIREAELDAKLIEVFYQELNNEDINKRVAAIKMLTLLSAKFGTVIAEMLAQDTTQPIEIRNEASEIGEEINEEIIVSSIGAYFDNLSEISKNYNQIYDDYDKFDLEALKPKDLKIFEEYMNELIESEKAYFNELDSLPVPEELSSLHKLALERVSLFIEYLPSRIGYAKNTSTVDQNNPKDLMDSALDLVNTKESNLYDEFEEVKGTFDISENFETIFGKWRGTGYLD